MIPSQPCADGPRPTPKKSFWQHVKEFFCGPDEPSTGDQFFDAHVAEAPLDESIESIVDGIIADDFLSTWKLTSHEGNNGTRILLWRTYEKNGVRVAFARFKTDPSDLWELASNGIRAPGGALVVVPDSPRRRLNAIIAGADAVDRAKEAREKEERAKQAIAEIRRTLRSAS